MNSNDIKINARHLGYLCFDFNKCQLQGGHSRWPKPPVDFNSKVLLWPCLALCLAWPSQAKAELLF